MANEILLRLETLKNDLTEKKLLDEAYKFFTVTTPIDTGNARRRTKKTGNDTIHANYAYATRLDRGWSNQAKDGMSAPTIEHIQKYIETKVK